MTGTVDQATLTSLITVMLSDSEPAVRIAAIDSASRLPLSNTAWHDLATRLFELIELEKAGSAVRIAALISAARIPIISFRERLRLLGDSASEPDGQTIQDALSKNKHPKQRIVAQQNSALNAHRRPGPLLGRKPLTGIRKRRQTLSGELINTIKTANQHADALNRDTPDSGWFGMEVIHSIRQQLAGKRIGTDLPAAAIAEEHVQTPVTALNDDQVAWVLSQGDANAVTQQVTRLLTDERPASERRRLLSILGKAGDYLCGRINTSTRHGDDSGMGRTMGRAGAILPQQPEMAAPETANPVTSSTVPAAEALPDTSAEMLEESEATPPDESEVSTADEQRRVHAQLRHGNKRRHTFITGSKNIIRCWIGLPDEETASVASSPIPSLTIPDQGLPLTAELCWKDQSASQPLILPANRTARSGDCDLPLFVPEGERFISAEVVFRYRGRAFEVVQIEAFAIAPDAQEQPHHTVEVKVQSSRRQLIELPDSHPYDATVIWGGDSTHGNSSDNVPPTLRIFGGTGGRRFELPGSVSALEWLNQSLFNTQKSLIRQRASQSLTTDGELDADSPTLLVLLRDMARHGAALYNELDAQNFTDPGERIQLLNREPQGYVPLEFIYDRGYPADDARLCEGWHEALLSDDQYCPACSQQTLTAEERAWTATLCPLGFWSMQKIIERVDPSNETTDDSAGQSHPSLLKRSLPAIDNILFAASHRVPDTEREKTLAKLQEQFSRPTLANNWDEWKTALQQNTPPLLLVIPHHDVASSLDFLEIGDDQLPIRQRRLSRAQITDLYVNPTGRDPGPILLLLGCRTGTTTEDGYVQLTRRFQQLKTSIVLGTMAQILGRHAAPVARELVTQLASASDPQADFGTIMRRVRRRMLANGYLMAFCLVALGDAEWHLTPRQTGLANPLEI